MDRPDFECPLSHEVMTDPVIGPDGYTYERSAIEDWLRRSGTSPFTRIPMRIEDLVPNRALKTLIEAARKGESGGSEDGSGEKSDAAPGVVVDSTPPISAPSPAPISSTPDSTTHTPTDTSIARASGGSRGGGHAGTASGGGRRVVVGRDGLTCQLARAWEGADTSSGLINVDIVPPAEGARKGASIICVVDVSSSMSLPATRGKADEDGSEVDDGEAKLSRLDLVKHCLRTLCELMNDGDELSIVPFSTSASILLHTEKQTSEGKTTAKSAIDRLVAKGRTNLWDGIQKGISLASKSHGETSILVFTDGRANISPPRGEVEMLQRACRDGRRGFSLTTFGFGYDVDAPLLDQLSLVGGGLFQFISDCSMVGTAMIHFAATALCTQYAMLRVVCSLQGAGDSDWISLRGRTTRSHEVECMLGAVAYGQSRSIVLDANVSHERRAAASIRVQCFSKGRRVMDKSFRILEDGGDRNQLWLQLARMAIVKELREASQRDTHKRARRIVEGLYGNLDRVAERLGDDANAPIRTMQQDLDRRAGEDVSHGQAHKACRSEDWFKRWGKAYLLALSRAHELQQRANFKDRGLTLYGGRQMEALLSRGEDVFLGIPPPEPTARMPRRAAALPTMTRTTGWARGGGRRTCIRSERSVAAFSASSLRSSSKSQSHAAVAARPRARISMAAYYNVSGGCFGGEGMVQLDDGSRTRVCDLRAGQRLESGAQVEYIVRVLFSDPVRIATLPDGTRITRYHPIEHEGKWVFPEDLVTSPTSAVSGSVIDEPTELYDVFLTGTSEQRASITINNTRVLALAHGIRDDPIATHSFLGTEEVKKAFLAATRPDTHGHLTIHANRFLRHPVTKLICGYE